MLNFATLNQAKKGLVTSDTQRHQQAADLYAKGRQLVREGLQTLLDKAKLKAASDCFTRGIQFNYKNPANYLGIGFLCLLLEQPHQALPYIKEALKLDPHSVLGKTLLEQAQVMVPTKTGSTMAMTEIVAPVQPKTALDYDDLYDATEAAILLFLKQMMSDEVLGLVPSLDPQQCNMVESKLALFQRKVQLLQEQLRILDEDMDTSDLRKHLTPVEKALQRVTNLAVQFKQFAEIQQDIKTHESLAENIIIESQTTEDPNDIVVLEENLETLLDHCDSIADQLDELEAKRISIVPLQSRYEHYTQQLEHFQDVLEETIERLKKV